MKKQNRNYYGKLLFIFLLAILTCNCTSVRHVLSFVDIDEPHSMQYQLDSEMITQKQDITIWLSSLKIEDGLPFNPELERISSQLRPHPALGYFLGIYFFYIKIEREFLYTLGEKSILESPESFISQMLVKESERSGIYYLTTSGEEFDYRLDVTIKKQDIASRIEVREEVILPLGVRSGFHTQNATSIQAMVEAELVLHNVKDGTTVKSFVDSEKTIGAFNIFHIPIRHRRQLRKKGQEGLTIKMIETLSESYKEMIEKTVQELNEVLAESTN